MTRAVGMLNLMFLPVDVEVIKEIATSSTGVEDKLVWHFNRFGRYTTKSHLDRDTQNRNTGESKSNLGSWASNTIGGAFVGGGRLVVLTVGAGRGGD